MYDLIRSRALLTSELEDIFARAPPAPAAVAHEGIKTAYAQATGKQAASSSQKNKRLPEEGDDCPVCYEEMHGAAESKLAFCEECGKAMHKECFQQCEFHPCAVGPAGELIPLQGGRLRRDKERL